VIWAAFRLSGEGRNAWPEPMFIGPWIPRTRKKTKTIKQENKNKKTKKQQNTERAWRG
jgi:hypothetical protein